MELFFVNKYIKIPNFNLLEIFYYYDGKKEKNLRKRVSYKLQIVLNRNRHYRLMDGEEGKKKKKKEKERGRINTRHGDCRGKVR